MPHVRDPVRERPRLPGGDRDVPRSGYVLPSGAPPMLGDGPETFETCRSAMLIERDRQKKARHLARNPGYQARKVREYRERDPERYREYTRRKQARLMADPVKRAEHNAKSKAWRAANPERMSELQRISSERRAERMAADPDYAERCRLARQGYRERYNEKRRALRAAQQTP